MNVLSQEVSARHVFPWSETPIGTEDWLSAEVEVLLEELPQLDERRKEAFRRDEVPLPVNLACLRGDIEALSSDPELVTNNRHYRGLLNTLNTFCQCNQRNHESLEVVIAIRILLKNAMMRACCNVVRCTAEKLMNSRPDFVHFGELKAIVLGDVLDKIRPEVHPFLYSIGRRCAESVERFVKPSFSQHRQPFGLPHRNHPLALEIKGYLLALKDASSLGVDCILRPASKCTLHGKGRANRRIAKPIGGV